MQQLKNYNSLLLQLIKGLQGQLSSKTRENKILFQQYERFSAENLKMASSVDSLRSREKQFNLCLNDRQALQKQVQYLKQRKTTLKFYIKVLLSQLNQKGATIALLQSQILQLRSNQVNFPIQQKKQENIEQIRQNGNKNNSKIEREQAFQNLNKEKEAFLQLKIKQNNELNSKILLLERSHQKDLKNQKQLQQKTQELNLLIMSKQQLLAQFGQAFSKITQRSNQAPQKHLQLKSYLRTTLDAIISKQSAGECTSKQNKQPMVFNHFQEQFNFEAISQQAQKPSNQRIGEPRNFFQIGSNFQFFQIDKKSLQIATEPRSQEIESIQELKRENNNLKQLIQEQQEKIQALQEQDKMKNSFLKKQVFRLQSAIKEKRKLATIELNDKNQIISELEETLLILEKGLNSQIMQLRKNNAELRSQILFLNKKLFLLDPSAIDLVNFVKDTWRNTVNETQFNKTQYNHKYPSQLSQRQKSSLTSYIPQKDSSRKYDRYFTQNSFNLGEKIIGRHCRGNNLNFAISNDFKLNSSTWQLHESHPF